MLRALLQQLTSWLRRPLKPQNPSYAFPETEGVFHTQASNVDLNEVHGFHDVKTPSPPTLHSMCPRLGLKFNGSDTLTRRDEALPQKFLDLLLSLNLEQATDRAQAFSILLAARLACDTLNVTYDPALERPLAPPKVHQKSDIPSVHGERIPWLVPTQTLALWRTHTRRDPFSTPWPHDPHLCIIYVLEVGIRLHLLCKEEAHDTGLDDETIVMGARSALFYASYKIRPSSVDHYPCCTVRTYESKEGLGASRLILMPEFDMDAAHAHGITGAPSRDIMLVAQPRNPDLHNKTLELMQELIAKLHDQALFPLPVPTLYALTQEQIIPIGI